ncbi:Vms1/Ankzf1 family peptidyl-tRNA hydrolase [Streptomyces sp. ACA25]|uniref:baeRF2 domain-containing protein n=1 Tax=Streptomyces sp. ACA25 TaxID=3022596 RepID=UPI0023078354|nr:Vms1/Ankzf1 family peptidyl-tRNA hydrolase [Streptomyces sp. ACA25]MDB1089984.1 Vms1/Ankzf1 family peptidyl-tRNA hydrolase [Streptomyces sp. ACA25]
MDPGFLTPLFERPGPWASVYFETPRASEDAAARQELQARGASEQLAEQGADDATCRAVHDTLATLPRSERAPGRAVFAAAGEVVLDPALTAPPPGGTTAWWAPLPHLKPLLELADRKPSCLVAYIDRTGADFEMSTPLGSFHAGGVEGDDWPVHRTPSKDWSEKHHQQDVENTWERNAAVIAEGLAACYDETRAELLVLAGDPRERRAVHDRLPPQLKELAVETSHGGRARGSESPKLDEEIEELRTAHADHRVREAMERFRAGRAADDEGRTDAVEGVPALVEAAREHRLDLLLLRPDGPELHREVWVGREPDQIAVRSTEVQYLGDTEPVSARADDALLRAAAATGARVLAVPTVDDSTHDLPVGGLGALLRWPADGPAAGETEGEVHA